MPGHMLEAICPCGFAQSVHPGSYDLGQENVVAYNPEKSSLETLDSKEAQAKSLTVMRNPYLDYVTQPMGDPEIQRLGQEPAFEYPKCHETTMRFIFAGFWD